MFLTYVAHRLMGPGEEHKGETRWRCPWCNRRGWHLRPSKAEYKDRWSCWHCGQWGDEHDLLSHFRPTLDYGQRVDLLDEWEQDWRENPNFNFARGAGGVKYLKQLLVDGKIDEDDLLEVLAGLRVRRERIGDILRMGRKPLVDRFLNQIGR